ncbi:hypothetical protein, partial [Thiocapsa sp.]|uniref:hypothetical protein n=1 Tax=Thiocapsa sp. TaxID=2024551 RepID=UPI003593EA59
MIKTGRGRQHEDQRIDAFLRGTNQDITLQKEYDKHKAIEESQYKTLAELHGLMNKKHDELLDFIIEASKKVTGSEFSFFGILSDDETEMTI